MIYCGECGTKNPRSAKFCAQCGHAIGAPVS
ncbi:MAG TPA: zinc-ribbon domain-containing protein [Dehalococcoidia bacterium]|nr:zinc-ribbon domain-containing protein [Dehalococcoidia bacterium]